MASKNMALVRVRDEAESALWGKHEGHEFVGRHLASSWNDAQCSTAHYRSLHRDEGSGPLSGSDNPAVFLLLKGAEASLANDPGSTTVLVVAEGNSRYPKISYSLDEVSHSGVDFFHRLSVARDRVKFATLALKFVQCGLEISHTKILP